MQEAMKEEELYQQQQQQKTKQPLTFKTSAAHFVITRNNFKTIIYKIKTSAVGIDIQTLANIEAVNLRLLKQKTAGASCPRGGLTQLNNCKEHLSGEREVF